MLQPLSITPIAHEVLRNIWCSDFAVNYAVIEMSHKKPKDGDYVTAFRDKKLTSPSQLTWHTGARGQE